MIYLCELDYKSYDDVKDFLSDKECMLKQCIGQKILDVYAVFDTKDKEWILDGPMLVKLSGGILYINTRSERYLCTEWNVMSESAEIKWLKSSDKLYEWQNNIAWQPYTKVKEVSGREITDVLVNILDEHPVGLTFCTDTNIELSIEDGGDITDAYVRRD